MRALVIVDVQNDFTEGGSLPVAGGGAVARAISRYLASPAASQYAEVVATQDYHEDPGGHFSDNPDFRSSWPPHGVAGTKGAEFHPDLDTGKIQETFRKGLHGPAYSGFEAASTDGKGLMEWLERHSVTEVDVVGLATDHCVRATALDAEAAGLKTRVLLDLTAGVAPDSTEAAIETMREAGIEVSGLPVDASSD